MKKNIKKYTYIPIFGTFVILFVLFAVLLTLMSDKQSGLTIDSDSAYGDDFDREYQFVESEDKNGVKYFIVSKNSTTTTTTSTTALQQTTVSTVSVTTVTTTLSSKKKTKSVNPESTKGSSEQSDSSSTSATRSSTKIATSTTATQRTLAPGEKIAYLTFDDGPSVNTEKLLDILDKYNVKATFFVIYHKNMEKKYKAIVDRGHTIALHSYSHSYKKIYKTEKGYYDDLNKIHDYVEKVTGVDSKIIRFPGGSSNTVHRKYNKNIMKILKKSVTEKGYYFHDWNVDSTDAAGKNRDPELLLANVKSGVKKRKVINVLMHDTGKSKKTTVEALPSIIEFLQSKGYKLEPLTEESIPIQHNW